MLICSPWQRAASTEDTACAADDVSSAGWTIGPCRIAAKSASKPTVPDYRCSPALHSSIYSENSAFVPVAELLRSRNKHMCILRCRHELPPPAHQPTGYEIDGILLRRPAGPGIDHDSLPLGR